MFTGNPSDERGYADVNHFVKLIYRFSSIPKSFIKNYEIKFN